MTTPSFVAPILICLLLCNTSWAKECTNNFPPLASHSLRALLLSSNNSKLREQVFSLYAEPVDRIDHLVHEEEDSWSSLLPPGPSPAAGAVDDLRWRTLYRTMKFAAENSSDGSFLQEIPLSNVRLDPGSLHGRAQQTNLEYLLMLDVNNLVWNFRKTAGLPAPGESYGGWEASTQELRGHFVGHYLSATAKMWASTSNRTLQQNMGAVVEALNECQKAMGTGYLSAFPSEFFDRLEAMQPVWAPYYTIHKIMAGLLDQYTFAGNQPAYNMTVWMAEYFYGRVMNVISKYTVERHYYTLNEESGGMNDVLYRLYTLSKNPQHLELAHLFDKPCFLGILAVQADSLSGFHANTHIPVVVGAQKRYEIIGDELYKEMSTFFMNIVNSSHAYATGGTSVSEFWSDPKRLADTLQTENEESCTTYNMLKVARNLFRWSKEIEYTDYYERALTNGVLSIQRGTEPGVMIYMLPLGNGVSKAHTFHGWGTQFNTFWCCYGTGIESFSKLGDSIYFEEKGPSPALYVIQFISSTLDWTAGGLTLNQTVIMPTSWDPTMNVSLEFSSNMGAELVNQQTINVRIPFWAAQATAMVNTQKVTLPSKGSFLTISRAWNSGDKLSLTFAVGLRTEPISDDRVQFQSLQAILFGPFLLAGLTTGERDLNIKNGSSISEWLTPVPQGSASQLFTLIQQPQASNSSQSQNSSLVLSRNNSTIAMASFAEQGTDASVYATFRIIDSSAPNQITPANSIGKTVYLEPLDLPGSVLAHQGANNGIGISVRSNDASVFKIVQGLQANSNQNNAISLESANLPNCYVYGGGNAAGGAVTLQCMNEQGGSEFSKEAATFEAVAGLSTYHPMSFVAQGDNRNFLLEPLLSFRDESYSVYLNITPSP